MTFQETIEYESGSCSFVMSCIYSTFPRYFIWVCRRKWLRYKEFEQFKNKIKQ